MIPALIILATVLVILLLIWGIFFNEIKAFFEKHYYRQKVYHVLHYYAEENDQLLLNDVNIFLPGDINEPTKIDHILFADKYVYVIHDYYAVGGIYGNLSDPYLFLKSFKGRINKVPNEVSKNIHRVIALEEALSVNHSDHIFVSVVCFNDSLIVPKGIAIKNQDSWFLSTKELEKTIKTAEKDVVPLIHHSKSEKLVSMLKERSDMTKERLAQEKKSRA